MSDSDFRTDSSNFPIFDFSNFSSVDFSDFSDASTLLSEKISNETRKFLNLASDKIKSSKINSMIDELVEQSLEQNAEETRIAEAKVRILESIEVEQLSDKIRARNSYPKLNYCKH